MIALLSTLASAAEPPAPSTEDLLADARARSTRGAVALTAGTVALGGGVATLLVRDDDAKPIRYGTPRSTAADLRSAGGAALVLVGFAGMYAGAHDLGVAAGLRQRARAVALAPAVGIGSGGLVLSGRF
jgi:hypothetical protein